MTTSPPNSPLPPLILLDGGLGTTLVDHHSIVFDSTTPLWSSQLLLSSSGRQTLLDVQTDFAKAGADVILSATYQASFEGFERSGVGEKEAGCFMRKGVEIARDAIKNAGKEGKGKVALSLGAYGATMIPGTEYSGAYDVDHLGIEQLRDWHLRRIEAFMPRNDGVDEVERKERKECWESIDFVAFETLPRLSEVLAVREVMKIVNSRMKEGGKKVFWISVVVPGEENALPDGSTVEDVVIAMLGKGRGEVPMGVGVNCTRVGKVERLVGELEREVGALMRRDGAEKEEWPSLVVYPDGTKGEIYDTMTKEWLKEVEEDSLEPWDESIFGIVSRAQGRRLWKSTFVGGCCKTTPDEIGKLRRRIDEP